jgi:GNAT superfamily N-acetyltransferase
MSKAIEELSLNNWQPLSTLLYDGWVLRLSGGYTKRANSISPIHYSTLDLNVKIETCEKIYLNNSLPTIFKITPSVHPEDLDKILEKRAYSLIDVTSVQTLHLENVKAPILKSVCMNQNLTDPWLEHFCRLNKVAPLNKHIMVQMLANIATPKCFISLSIKGEVIACGLGVIEREYIGVYDIVTDENYRNQGFGEQLLLNLLSWGKDNGAKHSYLAVVQNNAAAQRLYSKIGYTEVYKYWYRLNYIDGIKES